MEIDEFSIYLLMVQENEETIKKFLLTESFDEAFRVFQEESGYSLPKPLQPQNLLVEQNEKSFILQCIHELEKVKKLQEENERLKLKVECLKKSNQKALETAMELMNLN